MVAFRARGGFKRNILYRNILYELILNAHPPEKKYWYVLKQDKKHLSFSSSVITMKRRAFLRPCRYLSGLDINMLSPLANTGSPSTMAWVEGLR